MFFRESLENLVGALPKVAGALPKAVGALSFCAVRHGFS